MFLDDLRELVRKTLPDIISGLAVAATLSLISYIYIQFGAQGAVALSLVVAVIGVGFYLSKRNSKPSIQIRLDSKERQTLDTFIRKERDDLFSTVIAGSTELLVGDVLTTNKLFLAPPWAKYDSSDIQHQNLISHLEQQVANGKEVLLLGAPGQGKTIALKKLFTEINEDFLREKRDFLALYIPLRNLRYLQNDSAKEQHLRLLWQYLNEDVRNPFPLPFGRFAQLVRNAKIILLLDGFDEIPGELTQYEINKRASNNLFSFPSILSCRTNFYEMYLSASSIQERYLEKYELRPWKLSRSVEGYINTFCNIKGSAASPTRITNAIKQNEALLDLVQRPLLLVMMLDVFTDSPQMLSITWTLATLYEVYTEKWLKNESRKPDSVLRWHDKAEFVEILAWSVYKADSPSTYAYGKRVREATTFSRVEIANSLHSRAEQYANVDFQDILNDICLRTFLIGSYGDQYYFIHKSFQEYFVAKYVFKNLKSDSEDASSVLSSLIPLEIATFLKDMLSEAYTDKHERDLIVTNLIGAYESEMSTSSSSVVVRQHASYYLAYLGTAESVEFLEESYESEPNKWVQRGMMVGLARFCGRKDVFNEYIDILHNDPEAASINLGYHLVYYGDQPLEEGYYDQGGDNYRGTLRALFRHLKNDHYKVGWPLDLLTLRALINTRGTSVLTSNTDYLEFLRAFLKEGHENLDATFHREKQMLKELLQRKSLL